MNEMQDARRIIRKWKGDSYIFGERVIDKVGELARAYGDTTLLVASSSHDWVLKPLKTISDSLESCGVSFDVVLGARPNAPHRDVYRMAFHVALHHPKSLVAFGGGSTIDAVKAAGVLATYSPSEVCRVLGVDWDEACTIDPYFGTGIVTKMRNETGKDILPVIAVQTASGSAAHLTKYSNITDPLVGQKKLIVDDTIVPKKALFDYGITMSAPRDLTLDGALDGIAHLWEVFMGATGKDYYKKIKQTASIGFKLIVSHLGLAVEQTDNVEARTALGLGTDLGGYAIMIGGTNGPHLGSFSLVDILSHGRACAILSPYYTVLFSPKIQDQLRTVAPIFHEAGFIGEDLGKLEGRRLGEAVAEGMMAFNRSLGFPSTLEEAGATRKHLERMLDAAKNPQLKMKLLNMPIPLDPDRGDIEKYMEGVLEAAFTGDLNLIRAI